MGKKSKFGKKKRKKFSLHSRLTESELINIVTKERKVEVGGGWRKRRLQAASSAIALPPSPALPRTYNSVDRTTRCHYSPVVIITVSLLLTCETATTQHLICLNSPSKQFSSAWSVLNELSKLGSQLNSFMMIKDMTKYPEEWNFAPAAISICFLLRPE